MSPTHRLNCAQVSDYDEYLNEYTLVDWQNDYAPLKYMKLEGKNIEVFEETTSLTNYESEDEPKSEDDDEDDDEEMSTPFTAEDIKNMLQAELKRVCAEHNLFTKEWPRTYAKVPEMKDALMNKFGLEGSTASDRQQKIEETKNAMAAFLKLANVLAITSRIPGFDHKDTAHAKAFMEQYRKRNGKGTIRSRKST